jgi:hypothetical protein
MTSTVSRNFFWIATFILLTQRFVHTQHSVGTPCIPLAGKTALVIGQDYYSILNYSAVMGDIPFGVMTYTGELLRLPKYQIRDSP